MGRRRNDFHVQLEKLERHFYAKGYPNYWAMGWICKNRLKRETPTEAEEAITAGFTWA